MDKKLNQDGIRMTLRDVLATMHRADFAAKAGLRKSKLDAFLRGETLGDTTIDKIRRFLPKPSDDQTMMSISLDTDIKCTVSQDEKIQIIKALDPVLIKKRRLSTHL